MEIEKLKKNLLTQVTHDSQWIQEAKWREENATWLDLSFAIALKILDWLKQNGITQAELAKKLDYTPQYVNKIVKGSENLTLETICKIEKVLGTKLIEIPSFEIKLAYKSTKVPQNHHNFKKNIISFETTKQVYRQDFEEINNKKYLQQTAA